jgi:hypothetical protein
MAATSFTAAKILPVFNLQINIHRVEEPWASLLRRSRLLVYTRVVADGGLRMPVLEYQVHGALLCSPRPPP